MVVVKSMMFSAVLLVVAVPGLVPVAANSVPMPPEVTSRELGQGQVSEHTQAYPGPLQDLPRDVGHTSLGGIQAQTDALQKREESESGIVAPGSQLREVEVLGRPLALSLMRADRSGLAVLSVPQRSVIASLPEIAPEVFLDMVEAETGCQAVGQVQKVASKRGTVALATGIICS